MSRKFPPWLPAALIFVGGALAMRAGHLGFFAQRSVSPIHRGVVETTAPADGSTTSSTLQLDDRTYAQGDCVIWDQRPGGPDTRSTHVVPCDQPHLMEMTGRDVMPIRTTYPTDAEWNEIIDHGECGRQVAAYLGGEIDPQGRFGPSAITPTQSSWATGSRDMACGVILNHREAHADLSQDIPFTGSVRSQPQGFVYPARTCLAGDGATYQVEGSVPCTEPHVYEVVGAVDASKAFSSPPAHDSDAWWNKLSPACTAMARTAFGGRIPTGVSISVDGIDPASWRTGQRSAECDVARFDATNHPTTLTAQLLPVH